MKRISVLAVLQLSLFFAVIAQPGFNWPEDKAKAEESYALLGDNVKAKNWKESLKPLSWLLKNAPNLNKGVYQNGAKVYEGMVKISEGDIQSAYEDSAMMMYDLRIKYFNQEASVLNRKGIKAYTYLKDREDKLDELVELYQKIFELNGQKTYVQNTIPYIALACKKKTKGDYDDAKVLDIYDQIIGVVDANIAAGKSVSNWEKSKDNIDKVLASCVKVDCDFVRNNIVPKYNESKDLKLAKKIFALMNTAGCTNDPIFLEVAEHINNEEPSYGLTITIARKAKKAGNYDKALEYFNKCIALGSQPEKNSEIYFEMADIYNRRGDKVTTRSYINKSIAAGSEYRTAGYTMIGDLYFLSGNDCKGANIVENRGVYIAAYDMYEKAGNKSKMAKAQEQFPSMEEIFTYGKKVGDEIKIGCWINETVKIQKRP